MRMNIKHIALLLVTGLCGRLMAQDAASARLRVWSDQKVHVTGEDIWVDGEVSGDLKQSRTVTIRLLDRSGAVMTVADIVPNGFNISGYLTIPENIHSDYYFLDCTVAGVRTKTDISPVMVINPRIPPSAECRGSEPGVMPSQNIASAIRVSPDRDKVPTRTEVICRVAGVEDLRDLSIVVYRQDQLSQLMDSASAGFAATLTHEAHGATENEGRVMRARATVNGRPVAKIPLVATMKGRGTVLASAITDENGVADFVLPVIFDESMLVLEPQGSAPSGISISEIEEPTTPGSIAFPCLKLRTEMRADIEARLLNTRVLNRFYVDGSKAYTASDRDTSAFYGKPDFKYLLDEYVRFPNMEEVIGEIIPEARVVKEKGNRVLQVLNLPFKAFFSEEALVLVDGVPLRDSKKILDADPLLIRSIEVVTHRFVVGNADFKGVIHFRSYKGDMAGLTLSAGDVSVPFRGNQDAARLNTPEKVSRTDRMPDLRNLLVKDAVSAEQVKNGFRFYTSDAEGAYRILVRGRQGNGEIRTGSAVITVVPLTAD